MERQMDMFMLYSCPDCCLPTERKDGPCDDCRPWKPRPMLQGGWGYSVGTAVVLGGMLLVGAIALWLSS